MMVGQKEGVSAIRTRRGAEDAMVPSLALGASESQLNFMEGDGVGVR